MCTERHAEIMGVLDTHDGDYIERKETGRQRYFNIIFVFIDLCFCDIFGSKKIRFPL